MHFLINCIILLYYHNIFKSININIFSFNRIIIDRLLYTKYILSKDLYYVNFTNQKLIDFLNKLQFKLKSTQSGMSKCSFIFQL